MGFAIPGGYVYEPADLGLSAVTVGPTLTVNGLVVPFLANGAIQRAELLAWRVDWANTGATPFDLFVTAANVLGAGLATQTILHQNFTNNPIPSLGYASRGANAGAVLTGALLTSGLTHVFNAHYLRFGFRNNHATLSADLSLTVTVLF